MNPAFAYAKGKNERNQIIQTHIKRRIRMADNDNKDSSTKDDVFDPTRRRFIKNTGFAVGGIAGGSLLGGLFTNQFSTDKGTKPATDENRAQLQEARTFFSRKEDFETLAAVTERIFPEDDQGPGAIELGVPYFIDKQLTGAWGINHDDYTKGPFEPQASDTHGPQEKLNRGEMFLNGLRRMQEISQEKNDEKFINLEGEQQDEILQSFESGDAKVKGMRSDSFFELLRTTTLEGVYADPAYGGNKDMQAWSMIEYPGPRMGWADEIENEDFISKEPQSLRQYQGGNV